MTCYGKNPNVFNSLSQKKMITRTWNWMRPTLISGSCKMLTCLQAIIDHRPPFTLKHSLTILLSYYHLVHKLKAPWSVHPGGIIMVATDLNMDKLIGLKHPLFPQLLNPFLSRKWRIRPICQNQMIIMIVGCSERNAALHNIIKDHSRFGRTVQQSVWYFWIINQEFWGCCNAQVHGLTTRTAVDQP